MSIAKALAVYRKELRQVFRDRRTLTIILFVPVFFLLLYGFALNFDIRHIALGVQDRDATPQSRALVSAFVHSGYFDRVADVYSPEEVDRLLDLNTARAALVIPEGFGRDVQSGRRPQVQIVINGDNANTDDRHELRRHHRPRRRLVAVRPEAAAPPCRSSRASVRPGCAHNCSLPGLIAYILAVITAVISRRALDRAREGSGTMDGCGWRRRHVLVRRRQSIPSLHRSSSR